MLAILSLFLVNCEIIEMPEQTDPYIMTYDDMGKVKVFMTEVTYKKK